MTREQLLYLICPSERVEGCKNYTCVDCQLLLIKWLDEYDKQIRAEAIDEFAKKLIRTVTSMTTGFRVVGNIKRIAEQLKEQK